jgi:hypothetical protein
MPRGKKSGRINKMECMRQALAALGSDAAPKEIEDYLKREFNLVMGRKMISTYKGSVNKKAGQQSALMRAPALAAAAPTAGRAARGNGSKDDARAVKELADRIGPDEVRDWLDVLYR